MFYGCLEAFKFGWVAHLQKFFEKHLFFENTTMFKSDYVYIWSQLCPLFYGGLFYLWGSSLLLSCFLEDLTPIHASIYLFCLSPSAPWQDSGSVAGRGDISHVVAGYVRLYTMYVAGTMQPCLPPCRARCRFQPRQYHSLNQFL